MLLVSVGLWIVIVYNVRKLFRGNPVARLIQTTDIETVTGAEGLTLGEKEEGTDEEMRFVRQFTRLTLLELGVFALEMGLAGFLLANNTMPWMCAILLLANVVLLLIGMVGGWHHAEGGVFRTILSMPPWIFHAERIGGAVTAAASAPLFLVVNNLRLW
ncbi:MAG: hypothetical protein KAI66_12725 [Lentisphaeria bacterium]|nr:hypothetical protein [Lentisphaeria bacterium]